MATDPTSSITQLLHEASAGSQAASAALLEQVYDQLQAIARERMGHERAGHTLQATALVHEAYMRLMPGAAASTAHVPWCDRSHFYRAAAAAMRRILIDHARHRGREKRGGSAKRVLINVADLAAMDNPGEILAVDDAITRLQEGDELAADIVRLRFYAGLTVEHVAEALGLSERTVRREWTYARAKLFHLLEQRE